ncbi:hypothetical protein L1049_012954 [Liquidambar formosana]|uniref:Protein EARLY FLOWERING 4 domain-containing protein n=1 Tax=Liquidambar formosana TaxID=63359 RepID=A0AAP0RMU7_LIQFO
MEDISLEPHRDHLQTLTKPTNFNQDDANRRFFFFEENCKVDGKDAEEEEECDVEVWETLSRSFRQVQSVLDQNRALIQQVNENHQSKIHDNLVRNVALIREINGNIFKVTSIYSDLSVNFSNIVHKKRAITASTHDNNKNVSSTQLEGGEYGALDRWID